MLERVQSSIWAIFIFGFHYTFVTNSLQTISCSQTIQPDDYYIQDIAHIFVIDL